MVKTPYVVMDLLTFCVCNIVVNIYTTSALVYKIWRAAKNIAGTNHLLYRTCRILTESGILYTLPSVLYLACLIKSRIIESNDPLQAPTVDSIVLLDLVLSIERPLSTFMPGIAFNLITIRVGEQRARGQDTWVDSRDTSGTALLPSELLNHPDTSTRQEVESTDLDQEGREGIDEGVLP
ncbi:hypothetical protein M378DRAFT_174408, partial [Amanita muscaria Koide BX008]